MYCQYNHLNQAERWNRLDRCIIIISKNYNSYELAFKIWYVLWESKRNKIFSWTNDSLNPKQSTLGYIFTRFPGYHFPPAFGGIIIFTLFLFFFLIRGALCVKAGAIPKRQITIWEVLPHSKISDTPNHSNSTALLNK